MVPPWSVDPALDRVGRALADLAAVDVEARHAGRGRERDEDVARSQVALADVEALLGQHDDGAALGGLVGQRGQLGGVGQLLLGVPPTGKNAEAMRLPRVMVPVLSSSSVWTSPAASTARPLMASTLRWTRRSMPAIPMADSRAPMVVGIRHTSSDTRMTTDTVVARVVGERLEGHDHGQEDDREHGQQDGEGDLVRGLLPVGPLDQGDHAVEEGLARARP